MVLLSIVILVVLILLIIYEIIKLSRSEVIPKKDYLFLVIPFLAVTIITVCGRLYVSNKFSFSIITNAVSNSVQTLVFRPQTSMFKELEDAYPLFGLDILLCEVSSGLFIAMAVIVTIFRTGIYKRRVQKSINSDSIIIFGYSKKGLNYYNSNKNSIFFDETLSKTTMSELEKNNVKAINKKNIKILNKILTNVSNRKFIIFNDSNLDLINIINFFEEFYKDNNTNINSNKWLYIESDNESFESLKDSLQSDRFKNINIHLVPFNDYDLIAKSFVTNYPMPKYMPRDLFDSNIATIKKDIDINVVMIGFGNINKAIFKLMAINNQFAYVDKDRFNAKLTNYYLIDNQESSFNDTSLIRLSDEYYNLKFKNTSFKPCEKPCVINCIKNEVNSLDTYKLLNKIINKNSYTYIIVSFGTDYKNLALANNILNSFNELKNRFKIFTRVKNDVLYNQNDIIKFGSQSNQIFNTDLLKLSEIAFNGYKELSKDRYISIINSFEQYSNESSAMNLYHKISMLGYELKCGKMISKEEFDGVYKIDSNTDFKSITTRNALAYIEHLRWDAFYYLSGFDQLDKDLIKFENNKIIHKDVLNKHHACLCEYYDGLYSLLEYEYKLKYNKDATYEDIKNDSLYNIYDYDFKTLDSLYDNLLNCDLKISKKEI